MTYKNEDLKMPTNIYLIRHGESEGNLHNVFLGHYDLPLTPKGVAQAQVTANYLKDIKADVIYASDLKRAFGTAECTANLLGMPIIKDERLREIFAGKWEGMPFMGIGDTYKESFDTWLNDFGHARCDGGESVVELKERIISALTDIAKSNDQKTVFVFTHATPIRLFAAHSLGKTVDEYKDVPWSANASVTSAVYENGKFKLIEYGKADFMGDLVTRFSKNV